MTKLTIWPSIRRDINHLGIFLLGALCLWTGELCAGTQQVLQLTPGAEAHNPTQFFRYAIDESRSADISEIAELRWLANNNSSFNLGLRSEVIWVALQVQNVESSKGRWVLSFNQSYFDKLQVFSNSGSPELLFDFADTAARVESFQSYGTIATELVLAAHESTTLYIRFLAPNTHLDFGITTAEKAVVRQVETRVLFSGAFIAVLIFLGITLLSFVVLGWRVFVFYTLAQLLFFFFVAHMEGITTAYLWPENPAFGRSFGTQIAIAYDVMIIQFARMFFQVQLRAPRVDNCMRLMVWLGVAYLLLTVFAAASDSLPRSLTTIPALLVGLFTWIGLPYLAIHATLRWHREYFPIVIAWTLLSIFVTTTSLTLVGVIAHPPFDQYYYAALIFVEAGCLFAALMLRVRRVKDDNEAMEVNLSDTLKSWLNAQQDNSDKDQLIASTGHDARHIVAAMRARAFGLARQNPQLSAEVETLATDLDQILVSASGAAHTSGTIPTLDEVDIASLFNSLQLIHNQAAVVKSLIFRIHLKPIRIVVDRGIVLRILSNFVSNAVKFTSHGGILLAVRERSEHVHFQVWDTGPGISSTALKRILDANTRARTQDEITGTGLGIGNSIQLANRLNATIEARSQPGRGSVFELKLPASVVCQSRTQSHDSPWLDESCVWEITDEDQPEETQNVTPRNQADSSKHKRFALATYDTAAAHKKEVTRMFDAIVVKPLTPDKLAALYRLPISL